MANGTWGYTRPITPSPVAGKSGGGIYNPDNPDYFGPYSGGGQQEQGIPPGAEDHPVTDVGNLGGQGGGQWWDSISQWLPPGFGGTSGNSNRAFLLPALAAAYQQMQHADKYRTSGREASERADPFGKYRQGYGDRLQALYDDPSQIENTPGYKFALNQGIKTLEQSNANKGYLGSGKMTTDQMDYAQGLASQTWDKEADRLGRFAGAQFDPSNAARLQVEGDRNAMEAESNALGSLMFPFMGSGQDPTQSGGRPTSSNTSGAEDLVRAVTSGNREAINAAISQGVRFVRLPDGSTADLEAMARSGYRTGEDDGMFYPTPPGGGYTGGYGAGGGSYDENGIWSPGGGGTEEIDWGSIDWGNFGDWFGSIFGSDLGGLAQGGGL